MQFDGIKSSETGKTPAILGIPLDKTLTFNGVLAIGNDVARWMPPSKIELSSIRFGVGVASSGDVVSWDLRKNGVSVCVGTLGEGQYEDTTTALSDFTGDTGDTYSLDITSVGSVTEGAHLQVQIKFKTVE